MSLSWIFCHKFVRFSFVAVEPKFVLVSKSKLVREIWFVTAATGSVAVLCSSFFCHCWLLFWFVFADALLCDLWVCELCVLSWLLLCMFWGGNLKRFHVILDNGSIVARKWQQKQYTVCGSLTCHCARHSTRGEIFNERKTRIKLLVTKQRKRKKTEDRWLCNVVFFPLHKFFSRWYISSGISQGMLYQFYHNFRLLFASFKQPSTLIQRNLQKNWAFKKRKYSFSLCHVKMPIAVFGSFE